MSSTETEAAAPRPGRRSRWMGIALVVSLALNLVVAGGAVARFIIGPPPDRAPGTSQMQLIPRKFFGELAPERRSELLRVFRTYEPQIREGRRQARAVIVELAAALEAEPYDAVRVRAVVDDFAARGTSLAGTGSAAALAVISALSPDERRALARQIRQRDDRGRGRGDDGPDNRPEAP